MSYPNLFETFKAISAAGMVLSYNRYYRMFDKKFGTMFSVGPKPTREQLLKMASTADGFLRDALLEAADRPAHLRDEEM